MAPQPVNCGGSSLAPQERNCGSASLLAPQLAYSDWHPEFHYRGANSYAYLVAKYGEQTFDFVDVQLYEGYSRACEACVGPPGTLAAPPGPVPSPAGPSPPPGGLVWCRA